MKIQLVSTSTLAQQRGLDAKDLFQQFNTNGWIYKKDGQWHLTKEGQMVGGEVKFACVDGPEFDGHLVDFDQAMARQQQYKTAEGRAKLAYEEGDTHHGGCGHCGGDK